MKIYRIYTFQKPYPVSLINNEEEGFFYMTVCFWLVTSVRLYKDKICIHNIGSTLQHNMADQKARFIKVALKLFESSQIFSQLIPSH